MIKMEEGMRMVGKEERMIRREERMTRREIVEEFDRMVELDLRELKRMQALRYGHGHRRKGPLGNNRSRRGHVEAKGSKSWHH